jgi:hypothetical protein
MGKRGHQHVQFMLPTRHRLNTTIVVGWPPIALLLVVAGWRLIS